MHLSAQPTSFCCALLLSLSFARICSAFQTVLPTRRTSGGNFGVSLSTRKVVSCGKETCFERRQSVALQDAMSVSSRRKQSIKGKSFLPALPVSRLFKEDIVRRREHYLSDWSDGFRNMRKIVPAVLFLYFSCLAPAVSFGTIASQITHGSMGVVEFLLSAGASGMAYAVICGQPMAFIAPTGLTLAFISGLFRFCTLYELPFFPVYSWVGMWTSLFFTFLGLGGSSRLIRYCTRFTDEVFNALLSLNFINESLASLSREFMQADQTNLTTPFVALGMALVTFLSTLTVTTFEGTRFLNQKIRTIVKDFGPFFLFVAITFVNTLPMLQKFQVPTLSVPDTFQLSGGRALRVPLNCVSLKVKLLCSLPAILLTALFFMDQNISVRVVNNPENQLKKGAAYNLDMVALGLITGVLSLFGLPWMCGATVQSMNHVRALTSTKFELNSNEIEEINVTETRLTGFVVHAMLAASLLLLPLIRLVPTPVVAGVFLFLGGMLMQGNSFLQRIVDLFVEKRGLPQGHPIVVLGRRRVALFTTVQVVCLAGLWVFKQNPSTSMIFPSVIGMLMMIRKFALPTVFTETEFEVLGDPTPTSG